jgi:hypothetical protein
MEASVEAIVATSDEVIVKFDRLPAVRLAPLEQAVGARLKVGSNQLRFAREGGVAWMERLYALLVALRPAPAEEPGPDRTDALAPALTGA